MTSEPEGTTPLDADEVEGLLQPHVSAHGELNELEEANIQIAAEWALNTAVSRAKRADVLTEAFLYGLHQRMFGEVWEWAGQARRTNKNIGVDKAFIRTEVRNLVEDARTWRQTGVYGADEIAVRFHHGLVQIHPFVNGNGRHARLVADMIAVQSGRPRFTWGGSTLTTTSALRAAYIAALRSADQGDVGPLIEFGRS